MPLLSTQTTAKPAVMVLTSPTPVTRTNPSLSPSYPQPQHLFQAYNPYISAGARPYMQPPYSAPTAQLVLVGHSVSRRDEVLQPQASIIEPSRPVETTTDLLTLLHPALYYDADSESVRSLQKEPLLLPCPHCYATVLTEVREKSTLWSYVAMFWCGSERWRKADHLCPGCRQSIAIYAPV